MENNNQKSNKILLIVVIIILSIIIIGLVGYILFVNSSKENNESKINSSETNANDTKQSITYDRGTLDFSDCNTETLDFSECTKTYKDFEVEIRSSKEIQGFKTITINGKVVAETTPFVFEKFEIIDNIIVFATQGTDVGSDTIYAYNKNGNQVLKLFNYIDDKYETMRISEGFTISDDKIIFSTTRLNGDCSLILSYDPYKSINSQELTEHENEVVEGKYEVKYLGDSKFSSVQNISYTKLKDSTKCYD